MFPISSKKFWFLFLVLNSLNNAHLSTINKTNTCICARTINCWLPLLQSRVDKIILHSHLCVNAIVASLKRPASQKATEKSSRYNRLLPRALLCFVPRRWILRNRICVCTYSYFSKTEVTAPWLRARKLKIIIFCQLQQYF